MTHSNNKSLLLDLFGLVSSQLPDAIPLVLSALSKDYTPTHVPMEPAGQDKFFTALVSAAAAIAPIALSAAVTVAPPLIDAAVRTAPQIIPLIASAFSGDPQKKSWIAAASNRAHNPATGNNSLDLLGIIGSVSPESLPQIMQAVGASYQMGSSIPGGGYRPWQNGGGLGPQITPPLS